MRASRDAEGPTAASYRLLPRAGTKSAFSVGAQSKINAKDNSALLAAPCAPTTLTVVSESIAPRAHFALKIGIQGN